MSASPTIADLWTQELSRELGRPVRVSFGQARRNVIVAKTNGSETTLRLNERFTDAPSDVREALVAWLRSGRRARRACATLDAWIQTLADDLGPPTRRTAKIRAVGSTHDLVEIGRPILPTHFPDELPSELVDRITWGRRGTRKNRRSLQLGSYEGERDLIRIHPVLDQPAVPTFFVRYVLFHELLHAALERQSPPIQHRHRHHPPEFRRRESAYPDWQRSTQWQQQNLAALLRSAASGRPMRKKKNVASIVKAAQGWLFPD